MIALLIIITLAWLFWTVSRQDKSMVGCYIAGLVLIAAWVTYIERMG